VLARFSILLAVELLRRQGDTLPAWTFDRDGVEITVVPPVQSELAAAGVDRSELRPADVVRLVRPAAFERPTTNPWLDGVPVVGKVQVPFAPSDSVQMSSKCAE
jgi:hypothetical protein